MCCYDWGATYTVGYLDNLDMKMVKKTMNKLKKADLKNKVLN